MKLRVGPYVVCDVLAELKGLLVSRGSVLRDPISKFRATGPYKNQCSASGA